MASEGVQGGFATTNWSLVARAHDADPETRREAMETLLRVYQPALRSFLNRRLGMPPGESEELVQGFVVDRVLGKHLLEQIDQGRGKLRSLLMKSLQHYAFDSLRRRRVEERRLQEFAVRMDQHETARDSFALEWARQVLRMALVQTRAECQGKDRREEWDLLEARLLRPVLEGVPPENYETILSRLSFRDLKHAENALVTAKRRLRRAIESVVGQYVPPQEVAEEIAELMRTLGRSEAAGGILARTSGWEQALDESSAACLSQLLDLEHNESRVASDGLADGLSQAFNRILSSSTTASQTIGNALFADRPRVDDLRAVKKWARDSAESGEVPAAVREVVESSAIAVALVTCGEFISRASRAALGERFRRTAEHNWVPESLRDLSRIAARLLADE